MWGGVTGATKGIWWDEGPRDSTQPLQVLQEGSSPTPLVLMEGWKQEHPKEANSKFVSGLMNGTKLCPVPHRRRRMSSAQLLRPQPCSQQAHSDQGFASSPKLNQPKAEPASSQPSTEVRKHQANIFCYSCFISAFLHISASCWLWQVPETVMLQEKLISSCSILAKPRSTGNLLQVASNFVKFPDLSLDQELLVSLDKLWIIL